MKKDFNKNTKKIFNKNMKKDFKQNDSTTCEVATAMAMPGK